MDVGSRIDATMGRALRKAWAGRCRALRNAAFVDCSRHSGRIADQIGCREHDTIVAMIEKHYSRWIVEGLEDLTARAIIPSSSAPVSQAA
ncbi:hypothetical protein FYJ91_08725 [Sphingomonas montanisoli]|uniref:Uncharacterized protein n=1 Tax=Sphingomonas montanisoli TaxID=2606412 RepID=A0A5D9C9B9_9SPHN|nr:hypothetical protein FYJ91_08725 [Sphingomonas montanisoli]